MLHELVLYVTPADVAEASSRAKLPLRTSSSLAEPPAQTMALWRLPGEGHSPKRMPAALRVRKTRRLWRVFVPSDWRLEVLQKKINQPPAKLVIVESQESVVITTQETRFCKF